MVRKAWRLFAAVRVFVPPNLYYDWSKEFLEAGKRRLMVDARPEAISGISTSGELLSPPKDNGQVKKPAAAWV